MSASSVSSLGNVPPPQPTRRAATSPFTAARRRLILTNFVFVAVALLGMALLIYAFAARAVDEQINQELISAAAHEAPGIIEKLHEHDTSDNDPPYSPNSANAFAVTVDSSGAVAIDEDQAAQQGLLDRTATSAILTGKSNALFTTLTHAHHTIRLYTIPITNAQGQRVAALQVGVSLD
ncbi:MAG: hypothetical protein ABI274_07930, partial [Ktedonobacterales bacterium]